MDTQIRRRNMRAASDQGLHCLLTMFLSNLNKERYHIITLSTEKDWVLKKA